MYHQGAKGALLSVLSHCEECSKKVKYTGFRSFNSGYGCHGQGDLLVHFDGLNSTQRLAVAREFVQHANFSVGTFDESRPLLSPNCAIPENHQCSMRKDCDKLFHGLNTHGKCPGKAEGANKGGGGNSSSGPPRKDGHGHSSTGGREEGKLN